MYLKVIACEVACREIWYVAAHSKNLLDLEFLPVGHHDLPKQGHLDLQARINAIPPEKYEAILVGYGICNLMLNGLTCSHTPLVIPRAHDCITFFLGSKERYQQLFQSCPGTYYFTPGWAEFAERKARARGETVSGDMISTQTTAFSLGKTYEELVEKYGEDNARYLIETTAAWTQHYQRGMVIHFNFDQALALRQKVAAICQKFGWALEEVAGDLGLLTRWVDGPWEAGEFLVVQPGQSVHPSHDERVIEARAS